MLYDDRKIENTRSFWNARVSPTEKTGFFFNLFLVALAAGLTPFIEPDEFTHPIFNTINAVAPMRIWGLGWLIVAGCIIAFGFTRRLGFYLTGAGLTLFIAMVRALTMLYGKIVQDIPLTFTGVVIWVTVSLNAAYILLSGIELENDDGRSKPNAS